MRTFESWTAPRGCGRPSRTTTRPTESNPVGAILIDPDTRAFVPLDEARRTFEDAGVTPGRHVVAYCGGGISATVDLFLLHQLGYPDLTLYDGSMGEWARDPDLPIETGPVIG